MGEMTIRLDDALLVRLEARASLLRTDAGSLAADLLRRGLASYGSGRAAAAREILAQQTNPAARSSVDIVREDRER